MTRSLITSIALGALLVGCNNDMSGVRGEVGATDPNLFPESSSARTVRMSRVEADGSLETMAEAEVADDGSYEMDAPADEHKLIVQAIDAEGHVTAATILETTGDGGDVDVATMTTETAVEALVYLQIVADGYSEADPIDVRTRIDADVAAAVSAYGDRSDEAIGALSAAITAAQQVEVAIWNESGDGDVSQEDAFMAELDTAIWLNGELAGGSSSESTTETLIQGTIDAAASLGISGESRSEAESSASASLRLVLDALLQTETDADDADDDGTDDVVEAAVIAAAELEAHVLVHGMLETMDEGDVDGETQGEVEDAGTELISDIESAVSVEAIAVAFADFEGTIVGDGDAEDDGADDGDLGVFDSLLDIDLLALVGLDLQLWNDADSSIANSLDAAVDLDVALWASADTAFDGNNAATYDEIEAFVGLVVAAHTDFDADVDSGTTGAFDSDDAHLMASLLAQVTGSFAAYGSAD